MTVQLYSVRCIYDRMQVILNISTLPWNVRSRSQSDSVMHARFHTGRAVACVCVFVCAIKLGD